MSATMESSIRIRHTSLGGGTTLRVEYRDGANDDVQLRTHPDEAAVYIGREDLPKVIALLEAIVKGYPL